MFCGKCGTRNSDLSKFCRECGTRLPERPHPVLSDEQFADLRPPEPPQRVDHARVTVLLDVAFAYRRDGKVDEAIRTCLEAAALNPDSTSTHSLLAVLYEEKGQLDEALAHLQRVLELNPDSVADRESMARLLGEPASSLAAPARPAALVGGMNKPLVFGVATAVLVLGVVGSLLSRAMREPADDAAQTARVARTAPPPMPPRTPQPAAPTFDPWDQAPQVETPPPPEPVLPPPAPPRTAPPRRAAPVAPPRAPGASLAPMGADAESVMPLPPPEPMRPPEAPRVVFVPSQPPQPAPERPAAPAVSGQRRPQSATITLEPTFTPAGQGMRAAAPSAPSRPAASSPRAVVTVTEPEGRDYERWGMEAVAGGKYETAVENLQKALGSAGAPNERGRIQQHMGYAYQRLGRRAEAESAYREAISQYQQQVDQGTNADLARAGIRASQMGLRSLGP